MDEIKKQLVQYSKAEASDLCVKEVTKLYDNTDPSELDMPLTEFIIRNAFGNGVLWAESKAREKGKETKKKEAKNYANEISPVGCAGNACSNKFSNKDINDAYLAGGLSMKEKATEALIIVLREFIGHIPLWERPPFSEFKERFVEELTKQS